MLLAHQWTQKEKKPTSKHRVATENFEYSYWMALLKNVCMGIRKGRDFQL